MKFEVRPHGGQWAVVNAETGEVVELTIAQVTEGTVDLLAGKPQRLIMASEERAYEVLRALNAAGVHDPKAQN